MLERSPLNLKGKKIGVEEPMVERANVAEENGYKPEEIYEQNGLWYERDTRNPIRNKRHDGVPRDDDAQKKWNER